MNYHQGDVMLVKIDKLPTDAVFVRNERIQEGEITGHCHVLSKSKIYFSEKLNGECIEVIESLPMTHEDHPKTKKVEREIYKKIIHRIGN